MAESRKRNLLVEKIVSTYYQPDTGKTVTLRKSDGTTVLSTAVETPASSGNYLCTWNPASTGPVFGYWYVNGVAANAEEVWMGLTQGRSTRIFYNVTTYDSAGSPTGAVGSAKSWTTGSGSLVTDSDGRTDFNFTTPPLVFFCDKQTRRTTLSGLVTVSGGNVSFSTVVSEDGALYDATTCRADILIVSRD